MEFKNHFKFSYYPIHLENKSFLFFLIIQGVKINKVRSLLFLKSEELRKHSIKSKL